MTPPAKSPPASRTGCFLENPVRGKRLVFVVANEIANQDVRIHGDPHFSPAQPAAAAYQLKPISQSAVV